MTALLAPDLIPADLARKRAYTPRHAATSPRQAARQRKAAARRTPAWLLALAWRMPRYWTWRARAAAWLHEAVVVILWCCDQLRADIEKGGQGTGKSGSAQRATGSLSGTEGAKAHQPPAATFSLRSAAPGEVPALPPSGRAAFPAMPGLRDAARLLPVEAAARKALAPAETRPQPAMADTFNWARPYAPEASAR